MRIEALLGVLLLGVVFAAPAAKDNEDCEYIQQHFIQAYRSYNIYTIDYVFFQ